MNNVTKGFGVSAAADGLRAFASHYDGRRFVGRSDDLAALDAWLGSDAQTMLIVAPAGRGKSALLWHWVQAVADVVWVPISVRFNTARSDTVRGLLSSKLAAIGATKGGDWIDMAQRRAPVVVVLDGLDECVDEGILEDLRDLPEGVRMVAAARELVDRDAHGWAATLGWTGEILELGGLDRVGVSELVGDVGSDALNQIVGLSDGDPLTATLLAGAARGDGGFDRWWESDELDTELLTALARAVAPVPPNLLAVVLEREPDEVMRALHDARRFLVTNAAGAVSFAHPRLGYTFEERLDAAQVERVDRQWWDAIEPLATRLDELEPATRAYALQSRMTHANRSGASAATLAQMITRDWLEAWEAFEGGKTGFIADVHMAWGAIERELDAGWSDELCVEQNRLCAIRTALSSIDRAVSPRTHAAAVRVGVRSQRAAVAAVSAIEGEYQRNEAVKALIQEFDDHGFDLLLYGLQPFRGDALPVREIAERLLDAGLTEEAQGWILEDKRTRRRAIIELIDRFVDPEPFRAAVREDLANLDGLGRQWTAECYATSATVFDDDERDEWIARAASCIDEVGDENLFWDSYEGTSDTRLILAEALIDAGYHERAEGWLSRVWDNPIPFSEGANGISTHAVRVWAKLGEHPERLMERVYEHNLATWVLWRAELADRAAALDAIGEMNGPELVEVLEDGDVEMCERAARRAVELLDAHIAAPNEYGPAYALYMRGAEALGLAARYIDPVDRAAVLRRAWDVLRQHHRPITLAHTWMAVLGLLAATEREARRGVADEVMTYAMSQEVRIGFPALCDFGSWWDAFDDGHREYVLHALGQKRLGRPNEWIHELVELGDLGTARTALNLAINQGTPDNLATVAKVPELWPEIAERALGLFEVGEFTAWPLSKIIEHAPTRDQGEQLASRAWDARFEDIARLGCAGAMLAALPEARAEEVGSRLFGQGLTKFVNGRHLPPRARVQWFERQLADAEDLMDRAYAFLNFVDAEFDGPQVEELRCSVLDEAIATLGAEDERLDVLELLVAHLDAERAPKVAAALYERGSVAAALTHRLTELGLPELAEDVELSGLDELRARLQTATSVDDVVDAITLERRAVTYPWVVGIIAERGLADDWARHLTTLVDPSVRIVAWNLVWDDVSEEARGELRDAVNRTIEEERWDARTGRWGLIERLNLDSAREHWRQEMRVLRRRKTFFLPSAYARPLGLAQRFAAGYASVVRWFTK